MQYCFVGTETAALLDLGHKLGYQRTFEFNDLPARSAYQVVVFCRMLYLVITMNVVKAYLVHQVQFFKQAEIAVDRSEANLAVPLNSQPVELLGVQMAFRLPEYIKEQSPLRGNGAVFYCDVMIAFDSHSHL